ncbi:MAG: hypothetical protein LBV74_16575 [Tannerella sp.]|jgi:hypothetical protein|nr:hypothetical protein [Tannerella sp.]
MEERTRIKAESEIREIRKNIACMEWALEHSKGCFSVGDYSFEIDKLHLQALIKSHYERLDVLEGQLKAA